MTRQILYFLCAFAMVNVPLALAQSTIYTWVDDRGITHYGQTGADLPTDRPVSQVYLPQRQVAKDPGEHGAVPVNFARSVPEVDVLLDGRLNTAFVVDTGASITVLNRETAEQLGIRVEKHPVSRRLHTAQGTLQAVTVHIGSLQIGHRTQRNVVAAIPVSGNLPNLLGQTFLGQFNVTLDKEKSMLFLD